jgi:hypothetical protein
MSKNIVLSEFVRRSVALTAVLGASVAVMGAQTATQTPAVTDSVVVATPQYSSSLSSDDAATTAPDASSSATAPNGGSQLASNALHLNLFGNAMQYGGRQSYGRPRYRGSNTNADGSPKWDFYVGGGLGVPADGTNTNYMTTSWGLQGGGGRMFNSHFGVNLEFAYNEFGMTGQTITNQLNLYNYEIGLYNATQTPANQVSSFSSLDGNNHVWDFSLQPVYNIRSGAGVGAYVTGGAGFYHKVANFTTPEIGEYCDYYYGCYEYQANTVIDHYTSNALGINGGFGLTYKFSRFSSQRLYAEVRYVYLFNQARAGVTLATATPANANVYNDFPQNSNKTGYLPVNFGIRF